MTTGPAFDHLAIGAADLAAGSAAIEARLGAALSPGGAHPSMATHNRLLALGHRCYLEVIAADPQAPAPTRPRWFGLDEPAIRAALAERPRLLSWVVRVPNIEAAIARLPVDPGRIEAASRGELSWRITVPADGHPVEGGCVPLLIEWPKGIHPADRMPASSCRLERLALRHPRPERIEAVLAALGPDLGVPVTVAVGPVRLAATIDTDRGPVTLD
jgi:hypothetical protein